jgi:hypothetical protein
MGRGELLSYPFSKLQAKEQPERLSVKFRIIY